MVWPMRSLCQMAAVRARMRCPMRVQTPAMVRPWWCSRSSWPLRVSLIDSMICRRGLKNRWPGCGVLAFAGGSEQGDAVLGQGGFEGVAVVVFVADDRRRCPGVRHESRCGGEDLDQHVTFVGFGPGQRPPERQSVHGAQQMQPQTPEVAGVRGAVAVLGPPGQIRAFDRLGRASTLHGGRVDHPQIIVTDASVGAQDADQPRDGVGQFAESLVVTGLAGQGGEHRPQVLVRVAQPAPLAGVPQQRRHHRQGDQLGVGDGGLEPAHRPVRCMFGADDE